MATAMRIVVLLVLLCCTAEAVWLKLVNGEGRCSGTPQIFSYGKWKHLSLNARHTGTASVVCKQLHCGSLEKVAVRHLNQSRSNEKCVFKLKCKGNEKDLSHCKLQSACSSAFSNITNFIHCSDRTEVRLVGGPDRCSGTLELLYEEEWRRANVKTSHRDTAAVMCQQLRCGTMGKLIPRSDLGDHQKPGVDVACARWWVDPVAVLSRCNVSSSDTRSLGTFLTCLEDKVRLEETGSRCAGMVEYFHSDRWKRIELRHWGGLTRGYETSLVKPDQQSEQRLLMVATLVVCNHLNCGSAVAIVRSRDYGPVISRVCTGAESALWECPKKHKLLARPQTGVVCSELLGKPTIALSTPEPVSSDLQEESSVFRGDNFTITCSTESQYLGGIFYLTVPWTQRRESQVAVGRSASFFFPAAADSHQGSYGCVYEKQLDVTQDVFAGKATLLSRSPRQVFVSRSDALSLTVTDVLRLPEFLARMVLVPLLLFLSYRSMYFCFKRWPDGCCGVVMTSHLRIAAEERHATNSVASP